MSLSGVPEQLPAYEHAPEYAETSPSAGVGYTFAEETHTRANALYSRAARARHHKKAVESAAWAAFQIANAVWWSASCYGFRAAAAQTGLERLAKIVTALDALLTQVEAMGCIRRNLHRRWIEYQMEGMGYELHLLDRELEIEFGFCGVLKRAFEESSVMRALAPCDSAASSATSSSNPWFRPEQIRSVAWMTRR